MAIVQLRHDTPGRAYYRRRVAEGKTPMEALRALKRHLSNTVYRQLLSDASIPRPKPEAGPGGHPGATLKSSADGLTTPTAVSSDKSLPGPAPPPRRPSFRQSPLRAPPAPTLPPRTR